jgi:phosphoribosylamine--glycine ligase
MNVLVVGSGGREHALIRKIKESKKINKIYCAPGNAGISFDADIVDIKTDEFDKLIDFAKQNDIGLTVIGPEDPLSEGIVNAFNNEGLRVFGPSKEAARLEADKSFAKKIMLLNKVPTGIAATFTSEKDAISYIEGIKPPYVIKACGLCAGKGVVVTSDLSEAKAALKDMLSSGKFGEAGNKVLIEEYLHGEEASILAFSDGKTIKALLPSQDHKRIFDEDKGPNTGGMGAYAPALVVTDDILEKIYSDILYPTLRGLKAEGIEYKGIMYAGLMITDGGPKVIEYNARFGDPETQVVLPLLKTDIIDLMLACIEGKLNKIEIENKNAFSCCVIAASGGYPGDYKKGEEIKGLDIKKEGSFVYHAGTSFDSKGKIVTSGGRVLGVTSVAGDLKSAKEMSMELLKEISFNKMQFRNDIANRQIYRKDVAVIMGSDSDYETMKACLALLDKFKLSYEVRISSAHRTPRETETFVKNLKRRGFKVAICAAGMSAHLAGVAAALTELPVIGVPMDGGMLSGLDALLSTVNMPGGVPVATVSVGKAGAKNAAVLAARIIALSSKETAEALKIYVKEMAEEVVAKNNTINK